MTGPPAFDITLDELTLARARRGDVAACEIIFRLFNGPAYALAFRVCHCPQLAQDVTQEAFINAFRRLGQFRGDAPFWGWLRRVVVNQAISTMRQQPRGVLVELEEYHSQQIPLAPSCDLALDLEAALAKLNYEDRTIVWLHDVEGYGHKDIARLFGMTESFSKTRLSRARAALRKLIDPSGRSENPSGREAGTAQPKVPSAQLNPGCCL
jgi:RNA polymerase sigma-70 factor (ECF subfamily)